MRFKAKRGRKYKSLLETHIAAKLQSLKLEATYEATVFPIVKPSHYTPDWKISDTCYIEAKGYFAPADRSKLVAFKEQYPHIELKLLFANPDNKLNARSKTTYGEWAVSKGFDFGDFRTGIPKRWWKENSGGKA